jgi:hypothetical protein
VLEIYGLQIYGLQIFNIVHLIKSAERKLRIPSTSTTTKSTEEFAGPQKKKEPVEIECREK